MLLRKKDLLRCGILNRHDVAHGGANGITAGIELGHALISGQNRAHGSCARIFLPCRSEGHTLRLVLDIEICQRIEAQLLESGALGRFQRKKAFELYGPRGIFNRQVSIIREAVFRLILRAILKKEPDAVQNLLVPAGVIVSTLKSTADTGWIALNGTPVSNAEATYPALYSATSGISGWWSGSTFTPPDMTNKMLEGVGATAVGQPGGSNTATLGVSNLPAHTHTTTLTNGSSVVRQDGTGDAKLTANSTYGPYNTYTISATTDGGGNGTATGNAVTVTNAHIAVYFQIKAH